MAIRVDLRTRILPANHNVFFARPGQEYALYNEFVGASAIGPELPGVVLQPGVPIKDQKNLESLIRKASAIRAWARKGKPDDAVPDPNVSAYLGGKKVKGHSQFLSILSGYFDVANKGDLVLVSPRSYAADAVLAELASDASDIRYLSVERYGRFELPVRPVRVLARIKKKELPDSVLAVIEKPLALALIGKSDRSFLYDAAYGTYVSNADYSSRFDVTRPSYNTMDDARLLAFFNFVAANTKAILYDKSDKPVAVWDAIFADLGEYAPALKSNINSPGHLTLQSPYLIPFVAAVMLALAIEIGPAAGQQAGNIIIGNSSAPKNDPCTAEVAKTVVRQLKLYGLTEWPAACELARRTATETGLKPQPVVKETMDVRDAKESK